MTNHERGAARPGDRPDPDGTAAVPDPSGSTPREVGPFRVTATEEDGRPVLIVEGEVDTYTSARLRDALNATLETDPDEIVLDLSSMELIDSTGLGVLVGALKKLREHDGTMVLRSPTSAVMRVLSIVGLTSYFTIEE